MKPDEAAEQHEHLEHAAHGSGSGKKIAILIAVLAAILAVGGVSTAIWLRRSRRRRKRSATEAVATER